MTEPFLANGKGAVSARQRHMAAHEHEPSPDVGSQQLHTGTEGQGSGLPPTINLHRTATALKDVLAHPAPTIQDTEATVRRRTSAQPSDTTESHIPSIWRQGLLAFLPESGELPEPD